MKKLDILFNISHVNAISMIKIDADRDFLVYQRGDRKMFVTSADTNLAKKQERSLQSKRE